MAIFVQVALFALEEVLSSLCASVLRPPDALLQALLTSPCEIVSILYARALVFLILFDFPR